MQGAPADKLQVKAVSVLRLDGLARSKQGTIIRGHIVQRGQSLNSDLGLSQPAHTNEATFMVMHNASCGLPGTHCILLRLLLMKEELDETKASSSEHKSYQTAAGVSMFLCCTGETLPIGGQPMQLS